MFGGISPTLKLKFISRVDAGEVLITNRHRGQEKKKASKQKHTYNTCWGISGEFCML